MRNQDFLGNRPSTLSSRAPTTGERGTAAVTRVRLYPQQSFDVATSVNAQLGRLSSGQKSQYAATANATARDHLEAVQYISILGLKSGSWDDVPFAKDSDEAFRLAATFLGGGLQGLADLELFELPQLAARAMQTWRQIPDADKQSAVQQTPELKTVVRLLDEVVKKAVCVSQADETKVLRHLYPAITHGGLPGLHLALQVLAEKNEVVIRLRGGAKKAEATQVKSSREHRGIMHTAVERTSNEQAGPKKSQNAPQNSAPAPQLVKGRIVPSEEPALRQKKAKVPLFAPESSDDEVRGATTKTARKRRIAEISDAEEETPPPSLDARRVMSPTLEAQIKELLAQAPSAPSPAASDAGSISSSLFSQTTSENSMSTVPSHASDVGAMTTSTSRAVTKPAGSRTFTVVKGASSYQLTVPHALFAPLMQWPAPTAGLEKVHRASINSVDGLFTLEVLRDLIFGA